MVGSILFVPAMGYLNSSIGDGPISFESRHDIDCLIPARVDHYVNLFLDSDRSCQLGAKEHVNVPVG